MSTPICQGFSYFSGILHHFVLAKLAISCIRVKESVCSSPSSPVNVKPHDGWMSGSRL